VDSVPLGSRVLNVLKRRDNDVGDEGLYVSGESKDLDCPDGFSVILREASEEIRFNGSPEVKPEVRDREDEESVAANGPVVGALVLSKLLRACSDC